MELWSERLLIFIYENELWTTLNFLLQEGVFFLFQGKA